MSVETFSPHDIELTMSDKAIRHFKRQLDSKSESAVRLSVKESGCSGFMYVMDFVNQGEDSDKPFTFDGISVFVAQDALPILNGTEIDLVTEGVNSSIQFKNPNAKAMCGCGESFTL
ncbi:HesB/IscA family protein [Pleionea litopenaei]|uniref:Iron-sulfur cluster assembly accessory protein n=1 Tax=Pleionea litopenaei TaxID=3070815 RepID=A0AA51RU38_9GAMM|nr:iron-sulfur cluster assembly accessory protein [Pleionea sp. HL-JVS1]WMS87600.1 iron-sulfur cluster assembly accessory protein [Pleionea sp. HL-JVS1]